MATKQSALASEKAEQRTSMWQRAQQRPVLLLVVGFLLLLLPGIGMHDLWFPDEPDVYEPIRNMMLTGDWAVPKQNNVPWLDYPPLTYWLSGATASLLGLSTFSLRLPLVLASLGMVLTVFFAQRFFFEKTLQEKRVDNRSSNKSALLAAIIMMSCPLLLWNGTQLHVDVPFALLQAMGIFLYAWTYEKEGLCKKRAWVLRCVAFIMLGLSILAKGPLGVLLPGLILLVWQLTNKRIIDSLLLAPLGVLAFFTAAPWYIAVANQTAGGFVFEEFMAQNFERFTSANRGHGGKGITYYARRIWGSVGIWSLLVPLAGIYAWKMRSDRWTRLLALWFVISFLFLSAASTKREVYILPALPALVCLMAVALESIKYEASSWQKWLRHALLIGPIVFLILGLALLLAALLLTFEAVDIPEKHAVLYGFANWGTYVFAGILLLAVGFLWCAYRRKDLIQQVTIQAWTLLMIFGAALIFIMPVLEPERSYRSINQWLDQQLPEGTKLGFYHYLGKHKRCGFTIYSDEPQPLILCENEIEVAAYLSENHGGLVVALDRGEQWPHRLVRQFTIGKSRYNVLAAQGSE